MRILPVTTARFANAPVDALRNPPNQLTPRSQDKPYYASNRLMKFLKGSNQTPPADSKYAAGEEKEDAAPTAASAVVDKEPTKKK